MERVGIEPTQAYLYAGDLQSLELSIAQPLHKVVFTPPIERQDYFYSLLMNSVGGHSMMPLSRFLARIFRTFEPKLRAKTFGWTNHF